MASSGIESPCNRVCTLDPRAQLCRGCGRTLDEIAGWLSLGPSDRAAIMAQLPLRLAALDGRAGARA